MRFSPHCVLIHWGRHVQTTFTYLQRHCGLWRNCRDTSWCRTVACFTVVDSVSETQSRVPWCTRTTRRTLLISLWRNLRYVTPVVPVVYIIPDDYITRVVYVTFDVYIVLETGPLPPQDHKSGTVCRPISDYVSCHTASSGGYWRHFYSDCEAMAQCELFLCVDNAKVARLCIGLALEAGLQAGIRGECMLPHKRKKPESNRRRASFCLHCEILVICM